MNESVNGDGFDRTARATPDWIKRYIMFEVWFLLYCIVLYCLVVFTLSGLSSLHIYLLLKKGPMLM